MPPNLTAAEFGTSEFLFAGDEEDLFDTFTHEVMHYIEVDQHLPFWARITGDGSYSLPIGPAWTAEAWAVVHEAQGQAFKGRAKRSQFEAFAISQISTRPSKSLVSWDLSASNKEWSPMGAHYVVGSVFFKYLADTYGREKLDFYMTHQLGLSMPSDFTEVYGKSFDQLYGEFSQNLAQKIPTQNNGNPTVFDQAFTNIGELAINNDDQVIFVARSLERRPSLFRLSKSGELIQTFKIFEWSKEFASSTPYSPVSWSNATGKDSLYYFTSQESDDLSEHIPGIYQYDFRDESRNLIRSLPYARAAVVLPDLDTFYEVRLENQNSQLLILERGHLSRANEALQAVGRFSDFGSVSQLSWDKSTNTLLFTGIRRGGTWGIYKLSLSGPFMPELLVDTRGQDIYPRSHKNGWIFLSDFDGKAFQVYKLVDDKICALTHEPFFVRSLTTDSSGRIWAVTHRGSTEVLISVEDNPDGSKQCFSKAEVAAKTMAAQSSQEAAPSSSAFEESTLATLSPLRVLLPRYSRGLGLGFQALVAGEHPYKQWSWALMGDYDKKYPSDYVIAGNLGFHQTFPWIIRAGVESSHLALGNLYQDGARFLTFNVDAQKELRGHSFRAHATYSQQISADSPENDGYGHAFGFGVAHSFENTSQVALAAAPQVGWAISTALLITPSYFGAKNERYITKGRQHFYIPVDSIFATHSFGIHFTEVKSVDQTIYLDGAGGTRNYDYSVNSSLEQSAGFSKVATNSETLRGHTKTGLRGDFIFLASAEYTIPVNFLQYGVSQFLGRRWFNPESTQFAITLFCDSAHISGYDSSLASEISRSLSSAGLQSKWSFWINENHNTGVAIRYVFAKDLNDGLETSHTLAFSGELTF